MPSGGRNFNDEDFSKFFFTKIISSCSLSTNIDASRDHVFCVLTSKQDFDWYGRMYSLPYQSHSW